MIHPLDAILDRIKERLKPFPHLRYERQGDTLRILPQTDAGFVITVTEHDNRYTLAYAGWHEEYDDVRDVVDGVAFGLSPDCRLQVTSRGGIDYKWVLQIRDRTLWVDRDSVALPSPPNGGQKEVRILQYLPPQPTSSE